MGKLLCDASSTAVAPAADPLPLPPPSSPSPTPPQQLLTWPSPSPSPAPAGWSAVWALDDQQRRRLLRIHDRGVAWLPPPSSSLAPSPVVLRLDHAGEVDSDGNCLFTAARRAAGCSAKATARDLRQRAVRRFEAVYAAAGEAERAAVDAAVAHLYAPDLKAGWGVHVVQEAKLLARKDARQGIDAAINQLVGIGIQRETAAETIYKERCVAVDDGDSWAKYMSVSGSAEDEHDIVTLQYTEEGLLTIDDENRVAAFGDDIAIECLATEFKREVFVVQAHGADAMVDEDNCVFFLPHRPRGEICDTPIFLFMKGTAWCGAGADHYEPLVATVLEGVTSDKAAVVL